MQNDEEDNIRGRQTEFMENDVYMLPSEMERLINKYVKKRGWKGVQELSKIVRNLEWSFVTPKKRTGG